MAVLDIVQIGDLSLRAESTPVTRADILSVTLQELAENMIDTLHVAGGVGLAAPQVGINIRLFIAEAHPSERRPTINDLELITIFNPEIEIVDDTWEQDWEGCLSIDRGAMWGRVKRHARILLTGLDRKGDAIAHELDGFHARIAQHEADHLDGVLFFDRIYERATSPGEVVITTLDNYERFYKPQPTVPQQ